MKKHENKNVGKREQKIERNEQEKPNRKSIKLPVIGSEKRKREKERERKRIHAIRFVVDLLSSRSISKLKSN